jgi:hypothetical protein
MLKRLGEINLVLVAPGENIENAVAGRANGNILWYNGDES